MSHLVNTRAGGWRPRGSARQVPAALPLSVRSKRQRGSAAETSQQAGIAKSRALAAELNMCDPWDSIVVFLFPGVKTRVLSCGLKAHGSVRRWRFGRLMLGFLFFCQIKGGLTVFFKQNDPLSGCRLSLVKAPLQNKPSSLPALHHVTSRHRSEMQTLENCSKKGVGPERRAGGPTL